MLRTGLSKRFYYITEKQYREKEGEELVFEGLYLNYLIWLGIPETFTPLAQEYFPDSDWGLLRERISNLS